MKNLLCILPVFVLFGSVNAQNLEKIGQKEFLTVHGGINFNTVNYLADGMIARRDPFTWFANGNLTINLLDVAIPLTYSYSNLGGKFTQPFNQFSLHPTYKWIKTHIGYSSIQFSNYTLAGHLFLGGGIELAPGKWNFSAMGGRLNKEINYDALTNNLNQIAYTRYGYGMKGGFKSGMHEVNLIFFKAKDEEGSLLFVPLNTAVKPQDNVVVSVNGKTALFKKLTVEGEIAESVLTGNLHDETTSEIAPKGFLNSLVVCNASTQTYMAYKAALGYKFTYMNLAANYEHIDAGYKTLGGYFFNSDLENYTISGAANLFRQKLNIGFNTGLQYNNLDKLKSATTTRLVGSINVVAAISPKFNLTTSYSNFSNFTRKRLQTDPFYTPLGDTLNFYNQSQTASVAGIYQFGKNELKQSLQAIFNYNQSVNVSGVFQQAGIYGIGAPAGESMNVYTNNLVYGLQWVKLKLGIASGANTNYTTSVIGNNLFVGPMLSISKTFAKGFVIAGGSVYNRQYTNEILTGNVFNHRLSLSYKPKPKTKKFGAVTMSCNASLLQRLPINSTAAKITELNVFTAVGYMF